MIAISPTLRQILERRRKGPDEVELLATAHVFGNAVVEPISRRLSNTWWNVACRKAGIDDLHFHDLRHEFGSQLLEAGGQLHEVQATRRQAGVQEARNETASSESEGGSSWPADGQQLIRVIVTTMALSHWCHVR